MFSTHTGLALAWIALKHLIVCLAYVHREHIDIFKQIVGCNFGFNAPNTMPRAVVFFLSFRLCVPLLSSLLFSWLAGGWIFISHFTFRRFLIKIATNTHWKRNEEVFMAHAIASYINVRVLIDRWRAISLYFTLTVTIAYTIQNTNIHYFVSRYPGYGACVRAMRDLSFFVFRHRKSSHVWSHSHSHFFLSFSFTFRDIVPSAPPCFYVWQWRWRQVRHRRQNWPLWFKFSSIYTQMKRPHHAVTIG